MAVGDVVNDVGANNVIVDFQPAVGVEALITCAFPDNTTTQPSLYDGTNRTLSLDNNINFKIFVNNTNYFRMPNAGAGKFVGFTGVIIK